LKGCTPKPNKRNPAITDCRLPEGKQVMWAEIITLPCDDVGTEE